MTSKFASTIQSYNDFAPQFVQHFENKFDTSELDKFLEMIPKGGKVLDAGCGSARDSAYMISKGYEALGIDLSEGLLAEAKKIHSEVPTEMMSLTDLKLSDNSFNGIWCKASLLHIDRKEIPKVLADFYRILKPSGTVFIQVKKGEGEGTQPVPFNPNMTRLFTFFSEDEMKKLIKDAGFELKESYDFNGNQRSVDSRDQEWVVVFGKKI